MAILDVKSDQYIGMRREFILKVDGDRPIVYPMEYYNTPIHFMEPIQGFVLSLIDGKKRLSEVESIFNQLFPGSPKTVLEILSGLHERAGSSPSVNGVGKDGLIEVSDAPISHSPQHDPRQFILGEKPYMDMMRDPKTRYRLKTPINMYVVPTHRCQTDCLYCYADRRKGSEMSLARWKELIDEMVGLGIRLCSPDNGDVFARQDGVELMEYLLSNKMHFLLSTKVGLSKDTIGRLVDAGLKDKINDVVPRGIQISVDAVDPELGMKILNVKSPRLARYGETLQNFLDFGIMPTIKCVVTGLNVDQPLRIVEHFYALGARKFGFVRYARSFHRHTDDLFVEFEHIPGLRRQFDEIRERFPDIDLKENLSGSPDAPYEVTAEMRKNVWNRRAGCGGGWQGFGIGPDGRVFLCEQMAYEDPYLVGDASRQSIMEIWNSQSVKDFIHPTREQFAGQICETCNNFETCMYARGRCYRDAYYSYGTVYAPPPMCPKNSAPGIRVV